MAESREQFLAKCGLYTKVSDIPEDERKAMLERINVEEIDRHRIASRRHQRVYQAKKRAIDAS
jgi:hypothetical protein